MTTPAPTSPPLAHGGQEPVRAPERARSATGLWFALLSAIGFGSSGSFARALFDAGWSTGAAVTVRIGGAAIVLAVPTLLALRGRWHVLVRHGRMLTAFGLIGMGACQFCYFNAVSRLDVNITLLLEYLAPVLIVGWLWFRSGQRPSRLTFLGTAVSVAGLLLVLDVFGAVKIDLVGVAWGLGAAVSVAVFFQLSARDARDLPPVVMAGAGMVVAAVTLLVVGVSGLLPLAANTQDVIFLDQQVPWFVPVVGMVVVATALAYIWGVAAARRLGSRLAAFVGLSEVLAAVLFAWLLLGQLPAPVQLGGGVLIVVGIACIRYDELASSRRTLVGAVSSGSSAGR